jgi:formate/nitrite transporter FocA (FNT family)
MSNQQSTADTDADRFIRIASLAGIVVALLLTVVVTAMTVGSGLVPSAQLLAPGVFALVLVAVAVATRRLGSRRRV